MGFYSWKTADTESSIANIYSDQPIRTVYLLQPGGKAPIEEAAYEGHGVFGGVNAMVWLAKANAESLGIGLTSMSEGQLTDIGISLSVGHCHIDSETGDVWHVYHDHRVVVPGQYFSGTYDSIIPELGDTANNLIKSGRLVTHTVSELCGLEFPLKFSFSKTARYEELPASKDCPYQGYFF